MADIGSGVTLQVRNDDEVFELIARRRALRHPSPPAAARFSSDLAGLDVVAGRVLGRAAVDLLPDVGKVIALAWRCDNRLRLIHRQRLRRVPSC